MKAIERAIAASSTATKSARARAFADFPAGTAIRPNDTSGSGATRQAGATARMRGLDPLSAELEWSPVWSVRDERFRHLPTGLLYYFYEEGGQKSCAPTPALARCAAGNTNEEAILHGFLELVARDAQAIWWYNRVRCPEIDPDKSGDGYIRDVARRLRRDQGRRLWVLDAVTSASSESRLSSPSCTGPRPAGSASNSPPARTSIPASAALRAVATGLNLQPRDRSRQTPAPAPAPPDNDPLLLRRSHSLLQLHGKAPGRYATRSPNSPTWSAARPGPRLRQGTPARRGLDFLVLDQTRPDIEVPVVRVIVPRPAAPAPPPLPRRPPSTTSRFTLGLRKRRLKEADLNPIDPWT